MLFVYLYLLQQSTLHYLLFRLHITLKTWQIFGIFGNSCNWVESVWEIFVKNKIKEFTTINQYNSQTDYTHLHPKWWLNLYYWKSKQLNVLDNKNTRILFLYLSQSFFYLFNNCKALDLNIWSIYSNDESQDKKDIEK